MVSIKIWKLYYIAWYWKQIFYLFFPLLLELLTLQSWQCNCLIALDFFFKKSNVREEFFPPAMLTQVSINEWLTERPKWLFGSTQMWLEQVYRKQLITSALRKDLLQIDRLYASISKLRYELYDLKKRGLVWTMWHLYGVQGWRAEVGVKGERKMVCRWGEEGKSDGKNCCLD